ncbi:hypothetical protein MTO96_022288 [Rhipicephalus appendiculatus]
MGHGVLLDGHRVLAPGTRAGAAPGERKRARNWGAPRVLPKPADDGNTGVGRMRTRHDLPRGHPLRLTGLQN